MNGLSTQLSNGHLNFCAFGGHASNGHDARGDGEFNLLSQGAKHGLCLAGLLGFCDVNLNTSGTCEEFKVHVKRRKAAKEVDLFVKNLQLGLRIPVGVQEVKSCLQFISERALEKLLDPTEWDRPIGVDGFEG